jgi:serine/threonine protein kinase
MFLKNNYFFEKQIGQGGYGTVYKVSHIKTGKQYTCKITEKELKSKNEINIMKLLKNKKHIIHYHDHFEDNKHHYIIMELCNGRNIYNAYTLINNHENKTMYRQKYIQQCIYAIEDCHKNNIIHRDIKLNNFILKQNDAKSDVKLIDFGLSEIGENKSLFRKSGCPHFMPPECILQETDINYVLTPAYDIWSLGVLICMFYKNTLPFTGKNTEKVIKNIALHEPDLRGIFNPDLYFILKEIFNKNPFDRPNIHEVKEVFTSNVI